jgi:hypothetical protein
MQGLQQLVKAFYSSGDEAIATQLSLLRADSSLSAVLAEFEVADDLPTLFFLAQCLRDHVTSRTRLAAAPPEDRSAALNFLATSLFSCRFAAFPAVTNFLADTFAAAGVLNALFSESPEATMQQFVSQLVASAAQPVSAATGLSALASASHVYAAPGALPRLPARERAAARRMLEAQLPLALETARLALTGDRRNQQRGAISAACEFIASITAWASFDAATAGARSLVATITELASFPAPSISLPATKALAALCSAPRFRDPGGEFAVAFFATVPALLGAVAAEPLDFDSTHKSAIVTAAAHFAERHVSRFLLLRAPAAAAGLRSAASTLLLTPAPNSGPAAPTQPSAEGAEEALSLLSTFLKSVALVLVAADPRQAETLCSLVLEPVASALTSRPAYRTLPGWRAFAAVLSDTAMAVARRSFSGACPQTASILAALPLHAPEPSSRRIHLRHLTETLSVLLELDPAALLATVPTVCSFIHAGMPGACNNSSPDLTADAVTGCELLSSLFFLFHGEDLGQEAFATRARSASEAFQALLIAAEAATQPACPQPEALAVAAATSLPQAAAWLKQVAGSAPHVQQQLGISGPALEAVTSRVLRSLAAIAAEDRLMLATRRAAAAALHTVCAILTPTLSARQDAVSVLSLTRDAVSLQPVLAALATFLLVPAAADTANTVANANKPSSPGEKVSPGLDTLLSHVGSLSAAAQAADPSTISAHLALISAVLKVAASQPVPRDVAPRVASALFPAISRGLGLSARGAAAGSSASPVTASLTLVGPNSSSDGQAPSNNMSDRLPPTAVVAVFEAGAALVECLQAPDRAAFALELLRSAERSSGCWSLGGLDDAAPGVLAVVTTCLPLCVRCHEAEALGTVLAVRCGSAYAVGYPSPFSPGVGLSSCRLALTILDRFWPRSGSSKAHQAGDHQLSLADATVLVGVLCGCLQRAIADSSLGLPGELAADLAQTHRVRRLLSEPFAEPLVTLLLRAAIEPGSPVTGTVAALLPNAPPSLLLAAMGAMSPRPLTAAGAAPELPPLWFSHRSDGAPTPATPKGPGAVLEAAFQDAGTRGDMKAILTHLREDLAVSA